VLLQVEGIMEVAEAALLITEAALLITEAALLIIATQPPHRKILEMKFQIKYPVSPVRHPGFKVKVC